MPGNTPGTLHLQLWPVRNSTLKTYAYLFVLLRAKAQNPLHTMHKEVTYNSLVNTQFQELEKPTSVPEKSLESRTDETLVVLGAIEVLSLLTKWVQRKKS